MRRSSDPAKSRVRTSWFAIKYAAVAANCSPHDIFCVSIYSESMGKAVELITNCRKLTVCGGDRDVFGVIFRRDKEIF